MSWLDAEKLSLTGPVDCASLPKPVIAEYSGQIFCVWSQKGTEDLIYTVLKPQTNSWETPKHVLGQAKSSKTAALAIHNGILNLIYFSVPAGRVYHCTWNQSGGHWEDNKPCPFSFEGALVLRSFDQQLFAVYRSSKSQLLFSKLEIQGWTSEQSIMDADSWGEPGLYEVKSELHLTFALASNRNIRDWVYNKTNNAFTEQTSINEHTRFGLDVTSSLVESRAILAFQANTDSGSNLGATWTCDRINNEWKPGEELQFRSISTPAICISGNFIYLVYNSRGASDGNRVEHALYWSKRPLISGLYLDSWMSLVPDSLTLPELSLPGTHDSGASYSIPFISCHSTTITQQLEAGIRYFDLRGGIDGSNELRIYHGDSNAFGYWPRFADVFQDFYSWLDQHTTEVIAVQIKRDDSSTNQVFEGMVKNLINTQPGRWELGTKNLSLKEMRTSRKRIQLMRRFFSLTDYGINVYNAGPGWPDNTTGSFGTSNFNVHIQDLYKVSVSIISSFASSVAEAAWHNKFVQIEQHITAATSRSLLFKTDWYLNFASAVGWRTVPPFFIGPDQMATGRYVLGHPIGAKPINERLLELLSNNFGKKSVGTILLDYPEANDGLILAIVRTNINIP